MMLSSGSLTRKLVLQVMYAALLGALISTLLLALNGCSDKSDPARFKGKAIGTMYSVAAFGLPKGQDATSLQKHVEEVVAHVNSVMSLFKPDSELSRFNRYENTGWFPVSEELASVVTTAKEINQMTKGSFDITVAPLVNLWGFGPDMKKDQVPSESRIKAALNEIGSDQIQIRTEPPALRKLNPSITLDLAAIAKGYCVDAVSKRLEELAVKSFMVEIGGEIRTSGAKPDGSPWRIAVEKPVSIKRAVQTVIPLKGGAMATSGDYRNYFEKDGKRYSHIIDPVSGRPITHSLVSVSVMEPSCTVADAIATGLMVLGPERGISMAKKHNLSAFFIIKTADGLQEIATGRFPEHETLK